MLATRGGNCGRGPGASHVVALKPLRSLDDGSDPPGICGCEAVGFASLAYRGIVTAALLRALVPLAKEKTVRLIARS